MAETNVKPRLVRQLGQNNRKGNQSPMCPIRTLINQSREEISGGMFVVFLSSGVASRDSVTKPIFSFWLILLKLSSQFSVRYKEQSNRPILDLNEN